MFGRMDKGAKVGVVNEFNEARAEIDGAERTVLVRRLRVNILFQK